MATTLSVDQANYGRRKHNGSQRALLPFAYAPSRLCVQGRICGSQVLLALLPGLLRQHLEAATQPDPPELECCPSRDDDNYEDNPSCNAGVKERRNAQED